MDSIHIAEMDEVNVELLKKITASKTQPTVFRANPPRKERALSNQVALTTKSTPEQVTEWLNSIGISRA